MNYWLTFRSTFSRKMNRCWKKHSWTLLNRMTNRSYKNHQIWNENEFLEDIWKILFYKTIGSKIADRVKEGFYLIISNVFPVNFVIDFSFVNSALVIFDFGLPAFSSHIFIWSILVFWPSICPCTVFVLVFFTHPTRFNFVACSWVCWRK